MSCAAPCKTCRELNLQDQTHYAYTILSDGRVMWVAQIPDGGSDWGWTSDQYSPHDPAIKLNDYWKNRFESDQKACRRSAYFSLTKHLDQGKSVEPAKETPQCCPHCGNNDVSKLMLFVIDWFSHSLDPCDLNNTAILQEHQCTVCCKSFWM